jgi:DNA-binding NarL/FixJ family response regulator
VIRTLLVDDQALLRTGFRLILDREPDIAVVGEADDGDTALELARQLSPDIVLMDIRMPRLNGIDATRRLLATDRPPHVLILTTFDLDEYVYEALRAGAGGFLLKTVPAVQLVEAVRIVAGGEALLAPAITRRLIEQFVRRPRTNGPPAALEQLTPRELDVLRLLARGLSNPEIAAKLVVAPSTVKTHVASLLQKLDLRDRIQAVVLAYESGLVEAGAAPTAQ